MDKSKQRKYTFIAIFVASFVILKLILGLTWPVLMLIYLGAALIYAACNMWAIIAFYGNYCFSAGKEDRAENVFKFCIMHNSRYPTVYLNYAIMLLRRGEAADALTHLEKAINRTPKVITEKNIILTMGSCYWVLGEIDRAIEVLEGLRKKYEYVNCHVLTTLAYMYFMKDDYTKALELSNMAIEDTPDSGAAWDNLGQIYYKTGRIAEAKEAFLKALEFKGDLVDSLYFLAQIAEDEHDTQVAGEYYGRAMECKITALNTVKRDQIVEGYKKYSKDK